jgi:hypothetical protein
MNERMKSLMVAHGAIVFLVGMAAGFPYGFVIIQKLALWPIPGSIDWIPPGSDRAWRMLHLEGILNGLTLIAVAAAGDLLKLSDRAQKWVGWGLIVTAWGNVGASLLGPLVGGRGLEFGGGAGNSLMYLAFVAAVITVIVAMVLVCRGALANLRQLRASRDQ